MLTKNVSGSLSKRHIQYSRPQRQSPHLRPPSPQFRVGQGHKTLYRRRTRSLTVTNGHRAMRRGKHDYEPPTHNSTASALTKPNSSDSFQQSTTFLALFIFLLLFSHAFRSVSFIAASHDDDTKGVFLGFSLRIERFSDSDSDEKRRNSSMHACIHHTIIPRFPFPFPFSGEESKFQVLLVAEREQASKQARNPTARKKITALALALAFAFPSGQGLVFFFFPQLV